MRESVSDAARCIICVHFLDDDDDDDVGCCRYNVT